jgi:hypothetical protein
MPPTRAHEHSQCAEWSSDNRSGAAPTAVVRRFLSHTLADFHGSLVTKSSDGHHRLPYRKWSSLAGSRVAHLASLNGYRFTP